MQGDYVDPLDEDQPAIPRAPFSCAIISTTELIDQNSGEPPAERQERIFDALARFKSELHRQSLGTRAPIIAFGKSAANAQLQRILFGSEPVGAGEFISHFLDLPMALDRVAQRIRTIVLHPTDPPVGNTRTLHVNLASGVPIEPIVESGLTRAPLAELSGQVDSQQTTSNLPVGKPISLASVQTMTAICRPNSSNNPPFERLKSDNDKWQKPNPKTSIFSRVPVTTTWLQAYAQTTHNRRLEKIRPMDEQSNTSRMAACELMFAPGTDGSQRDETAILKNLVAGRPVASFSTRSQMRRRALTKRSRGPGVMHRKPKASNRALLHRRLFQSERLENSLEMTGSSAPMVVKKTQLVTYGTGYTQSSDCIAGKHVWLLKTNRCRVCGALKDEEFIRRALADRQRAMATVSQYETAN